jgi:hypothetical protein
MKNVVGWWILDVPWQSKCNFASLRGNVGPDARNFHVLSMFR